MKRCILENKRVCELLKTENPWNIGYLKAFYRTTFGSKIQNVGNALNRMSKIKLKLLKTSDIFIYLNHFQMPNGWQTSCSFTIPKFKTELTLEILTNCSKFIKTSSIFDEELFIREASCTKPLWDESEGCHPTPQMTTHFSFTKAETTLWWNSMHHSASVCQVWKDFFQI